MILDFGQSSCNRNKKMFDHQPIDSLCWWDNILSITSMPQIHVLTRVSILHHVRTFGKSPHVIPSIRDFVKNWFFRLGSTPMYRNDERNPSSLKRCHHHEFSNSFSSSSLEVWLDFVINNLKSHQSIVLDGAIIIIGSCFKFWMKLNWLWIEHVHVPTFFDQEIYLTTFQRINCGWTYIDT